MAGGKETPRQKMIGMMYLVLTALLALNVSKSILDAFVAIEENTQKSNIAQHDRGEGFKMDVSSEISTTPKNAENQAKLLKLNSIMKQMEAVDKEAAVMIEQIDNLKLEILKESGEMVDTYKDKDEKTILWKKYDKQKTPCLPIRMNLMAVQAKDQYDVPMHIIIGEDIKRPSGKGVKLWNDYNAFRSKLVELVGTYKFGENSFSVKTTAINDYTSNEDLTKKVEKMIDGTKGNLKEDRQVLIDMYINLTKLEKNKVHDQTDIHWIGMTFDHSPLVAAIASLSSMEQDILSARALALAHLKSKVTTGEYSFNKIMPLAYGPSIANSGDEIELQVMMAAFDSDNQPVVTGPGAITIEGGKGTLKTKVSGGSEMVLNGTVSIKNKSGVEKKENWTHTVKIMKPMGTVSLPELNVLYIGYNNKIDAVASGYDQTNISASGNVRLTKNGPGWIGVPTGGKEATISVSGKSSVTNKSVNLGAFKFRVMRLPDPEIYWGAAKNGDRGSKAESRLFVKYPPEIPLNAQWKMVNWECSVPGAQGAPPKGAGNDISAASPLIRAAKTGMNVSFICTVVGPDGVQRKRGATFKL